MKSSVKLPLTTHNSTIFTNKQVLNKSKVFLNIKRLNKDKYLENFKNKDQLLILYRYFVRFKPFITTREDIKNTYSNYVRFKFKYSDYNSKRSTVLNTAGADLLTHKQLIERIINTLIFVNNGLVDSKDINIEYKILKNLLNTEHSRLEFSKMFNKEKTLFDPLNSNDYKLLNDGNNDQEEKSEFAYYSKVKDFYEKIEIQDNGQTFVYCEGDDKLVLNNLPLKKLDNYYSSKEKGKDVLEPSILNKMLILKNFDRHLIYLNETAGLIL
ncbi:hypothetical protein PACTADRAFT_47873 [Pachysolen tannophilus NRRL Y-2460]|uniref:Uncharacterized protein n=1 Tax=Pachysolen tannophilus NRRL Y-2460 TaxID=669874 RepID=A0A1E4U227_PACTA|nr:hypothetical protein PACTADRAFT_47873 [Pachysolen tannophilus NRRL Y-2460]